MSFKVQEIEKNEENWRLQLKLDGERVAVATLHQGRSIQEVGSCSQAFSMLNSHGSILHILACDS